MPVRPHARTRTPHRRRLVGAAVALLALALALTGCTTLEKTRTAAFVNGQAISDATVAETARQFNDNLATDGQNKVQESQVLGLLILSPFVLNQVRSSGSWAPDARYNAAVAKIPDATQATKDFIATSIVVGQGGPLTDKDVTAILGEMKKANVVLDPRYGTWDPSSGAFNAPSENWIKPVPTASATQTAPATAPTDAPTGGSGQGPTGATTGP